MKDAASKCEYSRCIPFVNPECASGIPHKKRCSDWEGTEAFETGSRGRVRSESLTLLHLTSPVPPPLPSPPPQRHRCSARSLVLMASLRFKGTGTRVHRPWPARRAIIRLTPRPEADRMRACRGRNLGGTVDHELGL